MTDARRLIDDASPLPWVWEGSMGGVRTDQVAVVATGGFNRTPPPDAELVLYAVNRLPDYEAAVDALAGLVAMFDGNIVGNALVMHASDCMTEAEGLIDGTISCTCGADEPLALAETTLRGLRGKA